MALSTLQILRTSLESFRTTLQGAGAGRKDGQVSVYVVRQFNLILEKVRELVPEVVDGLPKPVSIRGPMTKMGLAPIKYLDLEILVDQVLAMIRLAESEAD